MSRQTHRHQSRAAIRPAANRALRTAVGRRLWISPSRLLALAVLIASGPVTADAAVPTPEFLAGWEQADRLLGQSDLLGAARAIAPLLSVSGTLDDDGARLWFDDTASRILSLTGRDAEARAFISDYRRLEQQRFARLDALNAAAPRTAAAEWDDRLQYSNGNMPDQETLLLRFSMLHYGSPLDVRIVAEAGPWTRYEGSRWCALPTMSVFESSPTFPLVPGSSPRLIRGYHLQVPKDVVVLKRVAGGATVIPSYFAGAVYGQTRAAFSANRPLCDLHVVGLSGAPTGIASGTSKHVVAIPATATIVSRRRVAARSRIAVQAFATAGQPLVVTWKPTAKGSRPIRLRYAVAGDTATIRAPARRGRYDLQLGIGSTKDIATGISGVAVGTSTANSRTTVKSRDVV